MGQFFAANGLVVCSISTIVMQLDSTRSIFCTKRRYVLPALARSVVAHLG
jgi:hypothetical protein